MRTQNRKPGEFTYITPDPNLTLAKVNEFKTKLKKLKSAQPKAIQDVRQLAEGGDFSENAAYQIAKGRLRRLNNKIFKLEEHLKNSIIINPSSKSDQVQLGNRVTINLAGEIITYLILGSSEIDLEKNIISHNSPIGSSLIGKKVGDNFTLRLDNKEKVGKIIKIG
ncbi:MAG: hypothetical protein COU21_02695 [Candidatus Komeilibacteria bacterium CG10_big_fil_rev_8_21_14_0_10_36_65]|nr:MAG: hypothetical protein COU21_02695 [Candidatus Komeilibacteria bacterium CG10_big_fil_rev_8_21_14_0_10_36_65]PJC55085.1 MAG: hypothetical protein CO027_03910 [Candidatus Komeilibacteria bacterium CG_4_9_14_0_2_um_filter_36_13]